MNPILRGLAYLVGTILLILVALVFLAGMLAGRATAQDHDSGHAQYHTDYYQHWKMPGSETSCCQAKVRTSDGRVTGDCYPTDAQYIKDRWWAVRDNGQPIAIPDARIIREHNPDHTGRKAHLCESNGAVYCFVPPSGGT